MSSTSTNYKPGLKELLQITHPELALSSQAENFLDQILNGLNSTLIESCSRKFRPSKSSNKMGVDVAVDAMSDIFAGNLKIRALAEGNKAVCDFNSGFLQYDRPSTQSEEMKGNEFGQGLSDLVNLLPRGTSLDNSGKRKLCALLADLSTKIATETRNRVQKPRITVNDVKQTFKAILPKNMHSHCVSEGTKMVNFLYPEEATGKSRLASGRTISDLKGIKTRASVKTHSISNRKSCSNSKSRSSRSRPDSIKSQGKKPDLHYDKSKSLSRTTLDNSGRTLYDTLQLIANYSESISQEADFFVQQAMRLKSDVLNAFSTMLPENGHRNSLSGPSSVLKHSRSRSTRQKGTSRSRNIRSSKREAIGRVVKRKFSISPSHPDTRFETQSSTSSKKVKVQPGIPLKKHNLRAQLSSRPHEFIKMGVQKLSAEMKHFNDCTTNTTTMELLNLLADIIDKLKSSSEPTTVDSSHIHGAVIELLPDHFKHLALANMNRTLFNLSQHETKNNKRA